jgi:hypothetical protein
MHALRTALFTVKGLKSFTRDGYEKHARHFEPKHVPTRPARMRLTRAAGTWKWICGAASRS